MSLKEPFEDRLGPYLEGKVNIADSLAGRSIADARDQLRKHQIPLIPDSSSSDPRSQIATFHDASIDIRIWDAEKPHTRQRRAVAHLGPQAISGFWGMIKSVSEETPEALADGAIVILMSGDDPECSKVALTRPTVSEQHHPEHEYVRVNPGTLLKAQQSYPNPGGVNN